MKFNHEKMENVLSFTGKSGKVYQFYVYSWPYSFSAKQGAIFLFTKFLDNNFHVPIFLGITQDLRAQFINQYELAKIINDNSPTHICICPEENEAKREFAEEDLSEIAQTRSDFQVH
jgi:hypothetical protein